MENYTLCGSAKKWRMFLISCALALLMPAGMTGQSVADASLSTIEGSNGQRIAADGQTIGTVLVRLMTDGGIPVTSGGDNVEIFLSNNTGILTTITDNNDGTYIAVLTSNTVGSDEVSFKVNGVLSPNMITYIYYTAFLDVQKTHLAASPNVLEADGLSTSTISVILMDTASNPIKGTGNENVIVSLKQPAIGSLSNVTYDGDYRYIATLTSPSSVGSDEISFSIDGIANLTPITVQYDNNVPIATNTQVTVDRNIIVVDGVATATITVVFYDKYNNRVSIGSNEFMFSWDNNSNVIGLPENADGTFTLLVSGKGVGIGTINIYINRALSKIVYMTYTSPDLIDPNRATISAGPSVIEADGISTSNILFSFYDKTTGNIITTDVGANIIASNSGAGTLSNVTYNNDGTLPLFRYRSFAVCFNNGACNSKKTIFIMALKFRKVQRKVLSGDDAGKTKTYARAKSNGHCDMTKLCKLVSARCAMSSADVKAIFDSLNWVMDLELQSGNIVQLGEFGNFRLSISSNGEEDAENFTAANIKKARILFTPGKSLRLTKDTMSYEYEKPYEKEQDCEKVHVD